MTGMCSIFWMMFSMQTVAILSTVCLIGITAKMLRLQMEIASYVGDISFRLNVDVDSDYADDADDEPEEAAGEDDEQENDSAESNSDNDKEKQE